MNVKLLSWLLSAGLALALGLVGKLAWTNHQLDQRTSELNQKLMESDLALGRANTRFGDVNKHVETLEQGIQDEIKKREAVATRFAEFKASVNLKRKKKWVKPKEKVVYKERIVTVDTDLGLKLGAVYQYAGGSQLYEVAFIPFQYNDHRLMIIHDVFPNHEQMGFRHKFGYEITLKISGKFIETLTPTGAVNNYLELYALDKDGKPDQRIKLSKFEAVVRDMRAPRWHLWAPYIDIGLLLTADTSLKSHAGGSLGFSVGGYGLTKNDLSWRFLRLSMDLNQETGVGFTPVLYNTGQFLPLISNLWIGPHATYGLKDEWYLGFMLGSML